MSKKHFIALADWIREWNKWQSEKFTEGQIENLAGFCERQNPRFNRELWLEYIRGECGPSGGKVKS